MFPVISRDRYERWCERRGLDVDSALFNLETCYYGRGLRSRPGAVFVWPGMLTHFSYGFRDSLWAMGEPSVRIDIHPGEIVSLVRERPPWMLILLHGCPDGMIAMTMRTGEEHVFVLQRSSREFEHLIRTQLDHRVFRPLAPLVQ